MDAIMNVLQMGGYGGYVWPAYGLATISLVGILIATRRSLKAREREFETLKNVRRGGGTPPSDESRAFAARGTNV